MLETNPSKESDLHLVPPTEIAFSTKKRNPGTSRIGNIARGGVIGALLRAGKCVLLPLNDDQRYDLVLDDGGRLVRVQCKSGKLIKGAVVFQTSSCDRMGRRQDYRGDVDFFGVYCAELASSYLVPIQDAPLRACSLRVDESRNNQSRKIRWAKDYLIPIQ